VGESDTPRDISRLTVPEAARQLGISPEAVRNRLSRGTLRSVKKSGTVYVLLEADRTRHNADVPSDIPNDIPQALVGEMRGRIESLERQLEQANERDRENRRIIAALTSRIPAIEASQEARKSPETVEEEPERAAPRSSAGEGQESEQRPWWRRMFGS
jgi:DNA-binding Lrp family transcriptional regulator